MAQAVRIGPSDLAAILLSYSTGFNVNGDFKGVCVCLCMLAHVCRLCRCVYVCACSGVCACVYVCV